MCTLARTLHRNDFNAWVRESCDEQWLVKHILRVITISLETMRIVKGLPALEIHPLDLAGN